MKLPIVTAIDTDAIRDDAMRVCTLQNPELREAYRIGVDAALLAIGQEFKLRLDALVLENAGR